MDLLVIKLQEKISRDVQKVEDCDILTLIYERRI